MLKASLSGHIKARQQLQLLKMSAGKRAKLLKLVIKIARKSSKRRLTAQQDLDGRKFAPRKGSSRRKLLTKLGRKLRLKSNKHEGVLYFANALASKIARRHHDGIDEVFHKNQFKDRESGFYDKSATRKQAKALRQVDYKIKRASGKGYRRPSLKWIVENLTVGQAGVIIKSMQGEDSKDSWIIPVKARAWFGANAEDINAMIADLTDGYLTPIKRSVT